MEKMERVCLDTDFLVDFLREKNSAVMFVKDNQDKVLATTLVNLFELYRGAYKSGMYDKNLKSVDRLFERFEIHNLSKKSVTLAGKLMAKMEKSGNIVDLRDLLIGTIAVVDGMPVKTNNTKDFSRIEGLKLA